MQCLAELDVKETYKIVIDDVIMKIEPLFAKEQIPNDILKELRRNWESKVLESGAVNFYDDVYDKNDLIAVQTATALKKTNIQSETNQSKHIPAEAPLAENLVPPDTNVMFVISNLSKESVADNNEVEKLHQQLDGNDDSSETVSEDTSSSTESNDEEEYLNNETTSLNSNDDLTDEDSAHNLQSDNIILCQYDQIKRRFNKWTLCLTSGMMNLNGKDYVFDKLNGTSYW